MNNDLTIIFKDGYLRNSYDYYKAILQTEIDIQKQIESLCVL